MKFKKDEKKNMGTHTVPNIRVVLLTSSYSLAKPKSDIFGFRSLSSKTLAALMSLWIILIADSSCRKAKALAIPTQIFCLVGQSNFRWHSSAPLFVNVTEIRQIYNLAKHAVKTWISHRSNNSWAHKAMIYQTKHVQGYCFPYIHIPATTDLPQRNNHKV